MLNFFRSESGNYVVGAIVVGIIIVFALEFRTGRGNPTANLNTACAVAYAGSCVDQKDYMAALGLASRYTDPKAARQMGLRKLVLDGLAERELLATEAERLGLGISDDVVDHELTSGRARVSLPADKAERFAYQLALCRRGGYGCEPGTPLGVRRLQVSRTEGEAFDYALYEKEIRILANRGPKEFRVAQERELLAEALRDLVRQRARVSEAEAFAMFDAQKSTATVRTVVLERSWFAKYAIDTSEAAAEKWAAENTAPVEEAWKADKDKFVAGCPLVSEITLALPPNAFDTEKTPVKERITALRERVTKGESFEAVAREASSAASAPLGGKVGCLNATYGLGSDTLLEAAKKLTPGGISEVLETPRGFHVLRLDGTLDAAHVEREGKKQLARGLYLASAADQSMRLFAAELIKQAQSGAKLEEANRALSDELARRTAPKTAAKGAGLPPGLLATDRPRFEVSTPFSAAGNPLPDLETREGLTTRAFALAAPDAVDPKPIDTATGLVVLQLKEKTPASREEFAKDKLAIIRDLAQAKANEALSRYVAELKRAAGTKLTVDAHFAEEAKPVQGEE